MGMNQQQLTDFLWSNYHPQSIWIVFSSMAVGAVVLLFVYDKFILTQKTK